MERRLILIALLLALGCNQLVAAEKPVSDEGHADLEDEHLPVKIDIATALAAETDQDERASAIEKGSNDKWAMITKTSRGTEMLFTYYHNETHSIPEALRENILGDVAEMLNFMGGLFEIALTSEANIFSRTAQISKKIYDLQKVGRKQAVRRKALGMNQPFQKQYNRDMQKMFSRLLKKSGVYEKELKASGYQKDSVALKKRLDAFLADLIEGFAKSPVAIFVDWPTSYMSSENAITGEKEVMPFETTAANLMGEVKLNGFGLILNGLGAFISLVNNLTG